MTLDQMVENSIQFGTANAIAIAVTVAVIFLIAFMARRKIRHGWLSFKTWYRLNRLGNKRIANFKWPDGLGHYFTVDRLILHANGISLLMFNRYPGKIFCADNIDEWTQMVGQKSFRFPNPLHELDFRIKTLAAELPNVSVDGYLFFDHLAEFPKGHPERVINLNRIPEEFKPDKSNKPNETLLVAWDALLAKNLL